MTITRQDAEAFFQLHLKHDFWSSLSAAQQESALAMAEQDITAYLNVPELDEADPNEFAAVCEQAIFLAANPDRSIHDRLITAETIDGAGSCHYRYISELPFPIAPRAVLLLEHLRHRICFSRG